MFARTLTSELHKQARDYPVVTVIGPRQSGKTTLVRATFSTMPYVNLEEPDIRELAMNDPRGFLANYPDGAILDEIQRAPELLSYIQVLVDAKGKPGMFILTGSHQLQLHGAISQSLAGRTSLLELLPLSLSELRALKVDMTLDSYLLKGFYPRIYESSLESTTFYRNYVRTYIERDLRQIVEVKDLHSFHRFIKLSAGRVGSILNMESLGNDVGISNQTVKNWLSILEASYLIVRLQPYFENFGKRIIKSPKLYFTDVGLVSYLLGIESLVQVNRDPLRGALFENLVLIDLLKMRFNRGLDSNLYYYRDNHKNEVDLIIKKGNELIPIEIKSAETYNSAYLKNINFFQSLVGERCKKAFVIYAGEQEQQIGKVHLINFKNAARVFE